MKEEQILDGEKDEVGALPVEEIVPANSLFP